jgi:hypothetical protein
MPKVTPRMIEEAVEHCAIQPIDKGGIEYCVKCPLGSFESCGDIVVWREYPPYLQHPNRLTKEQRTELSKVVCEAMFDPLYIDLIEVKEGCHDAPDKERG